MLQHDTEQILRDLISRLERDRKFGEASAVEEVLAEAAASRAMDSRYAEQRDGRAAEYTRSIESLRAHADRYLLLRAGELEEYLQVVDVETGEALLGEELDAAIDRAKAEIDAPPPESKGPTKSLLGEWAA